MCLWIWWKLYYSSVLYNTTLQSASISEPRILLFFPRTWVESLSLYLLGSMSTPEGWIYRENVLKSHQDRNANVVIPHKKQHWWSMRGRKRPSRWPSWRWLWRWPGAVQLQSRHAASDHPPGSARFELSTCQVIFLDIKAIKCINTKGWEWSWWCNIRVAWQSWSRGDCPASSCRQTSAQHRMCCTLGRNSGSSKPGLEKDDG